MDTARLAAVHPVVDDLRRIFAERLEAVVVYGRRPIGPVPTLALVQSLAMEDLNTCAERAAGWRRGGAAVPLLLTRAEFARALDAFPLEYGEIIDHHQLLHGHDPFQDLAIRHEDLRRACEVQVKSHLLHLREDYIESGAKLHDVGDIVRESAAGFVMLLRQLARLDRASVDSEAEIARYAETRLRLDPRLVGDLITVADGTSFAPVDAMKLFPPYLEAMNRLADFVDQWRFV